MIQIIPAIDLIGGKCVRLTQGDYARQITYEQDPVSLAKSFEDAGISRLHLVDLDGAKAKKVVNHEVLRAICRETNLIVDFGGGIQSDEDLGKVFEAGAEMVTCGSIAVREREKFIDWVQTHGTERIILAADARNGMVAVSGWQDNSGLPLEDFINSYTKQGITQVLCTDIGRDGMLQGPAVELYADIQAQYPALKLIASGGVSCIDDIRQLNQVDVYGVVVGKALLEGRISLAEIVRMS